MATATWPSTNATGITGSGNWAQYGSWFLDTSQNNTNGYTNVFFEFGSNAGSNKGFEFRAVNGNTELHMNTDDNTDDPGFFRIGSGTNVQSGQIQTGDVVTLVRYETHPWTDPANTPSTATTDVYTFTVASNMLFAWSGIGTLSNSGSLQKSGSNLVWTISSVSQDGDYGVTESSDGGSTWVVKISIVIPNLAGTRTGNVFNWNETYLYKLYDPEENVLGSYTPSTTTNITKVFCNFW